MYSEEGEKREHKAQEFKFIHKSLLQIVESVNLKIGVGTLTAVATAPT